MKLGFIGTGAIAEAVVTGLCEAGAPGLSILVSPRNRERSQRLSERYAAVEVAADNQQVVDRTELVFLAVRPQVAEAVLAALAFRPEQRVASFIATLDSADIRRHTQPAQLVARIAPVPPVARRKGPIAMCPPDNQLAKLFDPIGTLLQVSDETQLDAFFSVSALMAPYFELLQAVSAWLRAQGVEAAQADAYTGSLFAAIAEKSTQPAGEGFAELAAEHATRAGINEQLRRELLASGFYDRVRAGLDLIQARMQGRATLQDTLQTN
ncbi:pyrroline-5-carboxylate reductase [Candidatus Foliamicus sp.]